MGLGLGLAESKRATVTSSLQALNLAMLPLTLP